MRFVGCLCAEELLERFGEYVIGIGENDGNIGLEEVS